MAPRDLPPADFAARSLGLKNEPALPFGDASTMPNERRDELADIINDSNLAIVCSNKRAYFSIPRARGNRWPQTRPSLLSQTGGVNEYSLKGRHLEHRLHRCVSHGIIFYLEGGVMGRVVRGPRLRAVYRPSATVGEGEAHVGPAPGAQQQPGDNYLDRTAKYVPAEVLGFFLFVNNILEQATKASGDKPAVMAGCLSVSLIAWIALLLGALLTPIYVWYVHEEGDAWKLHATVSFIAFPIWAYAIGAVAFITYRDGNLASIMLATFTVISGLVRPRQEIGHRPSDGGRRLPEEPPGPRVIATPGPGTTKTGDSGDRPNDNQVEGKRQ